MLKQITRIFFPSLLTIPFLLVMATVFVVDQELGNGVVSGKYFWFYGMMIGVALSAMIALLIKRKVVWVRGVDYLILIFAAIVLLKQNSCPVYFDNTTKFTHLGLLFFLYVFMRTFLSQYSSAYTFLIIGLLVTGLVEAVWGLRQLYGWDVSNHSLFKLTGSFFNPGPYSGYLALTAPAAFCYILADWRVTKRKFQLRLWPFYLRFTVSIVTFCTVMMVLPAAMSRASWLGCLGGCCLAAGGYYLRKRRVIQYIRQRKKQLAMVVVLLCLIFSGLGAGMYYLKKDSADGRALIWKISAGMIPKYPLGVGLGNFSGMYGKEQAAYFALGQGTEQEEYVAGNPEYAFNEYLQIAVELGIIPFAVFIILLITVIYFGIKDKKMAPTASLFSLLIFAGMSYPFSVLPFLIILVFLIALISSSPTACSVPSDLNIKNKKEQMKIKPKWVLLFQFFLLFLSSVIVLYLLKDKSTAYDVYKRWSKEKIMYQTGMYKEAVEGYSIDYPYLSDQITFLFEYAQCLSKSEQYGESNRVLERAVQISCDPMLYNVMGKNYQALKDYKASENHFLIASNIVPNRVYPYFLLANLYREMGENEKAILAAKAVMTKEPKVNSTAIKEMREKMKEMIKELKVEN